MAEQFKIPQIDYTSRDFVSIRDDLIKRIPFFTPEWTDHNPTDFGIVLVELFAYVADILHFYIDKQAAEGFLDTAKLRQSVINLLKLIDYRPHGPTAATVDLVFSLPAVQTSDVLIPKGTLVSTQSLAGEEIVYFETVQSLTIPAGSLSGTVGAEEGRTFEENFTSNGQKFQKFTLSRSSVLDNTIKVFVNEGIVEEQWIRLDSFALASPTDKIYVVSFDADNKATIEFGDGGQGKVPVNNAAIRIVYKVGGGLKGNVGANTITQVVSTILHGGSPIQVSVTNPNPATGGGDAQSITDAKIQGPLTLKTLNRAVTLEDIKALALQVSGVAKARAVQVQPTILREVNLYIAPSGGGLPSATLLNNVLAFLDDKKIAGNIIIALPPRYVKFLAKGTVYVKSNFIQQDVINAVNSAIDSFFSFNNPSVDFGGSVRLSDFFALIDNTEGVDYVDFDYIHFDPLDTVRLDVWNGDSQFVLIELSEKSVDEEITVNFFSDTQFSVSGSVSGPQTSTGVVGSDYVMDGGQLKFRIAAGTVPNKVGDRARFRSMKQLGNVILLDDEIIQKGTIQLSFVGGA